MHYKKKGGGGGLEKKDSGHLQLHLILTSCHLNPLPTFNEWVLRMRIYNTAISKQCFWDNSVDDLPAETCYSHVS
ncbi:hypothetical protein FKM82_008940 [Ascaphus truei]